MIIDFHTHTLLSDGALSVAEHIRRAYVNGYKTLGITDHVDFSNIEEVFTAVLKHIENTKDSYPLNIIPGVEITHVPTNKIEKIVQKARDLKIPLVIVHGESPVEPVEEGTNRAAIESLVDILAHPGIMNEEDIILASKLGVSLEITAKRGHNLGNGLIAKLAKKHSAKLVLNSDCHRPEEFLSEKLRETVMVGMGMEREEIDKLEKNVVDLSNILIERVEKL